MRTRLGWGLTAGVLAGLAGLLAFALFASAAPVVPVPNPIATVVTKSGTTTRTTLVPLGGAPIPISVDNDLLPDVNVAVGLVAPDEGVALVPNVVIRRAIIPPLLVRQPSPPLDIDVKIELFDAGAVGRLAEIHYGYKTPPGGHIPPVIAAKLVGPVQGGFIDPLRAKIDSPGYNGPLDLNLGVRTAELDAHFDADFDPLPEHALVEYDPRADGLDALFTHTGRVADVHLDAFASLRDRTTNGLREIGADIDRLPQRIALASTITAGGVNVLYDSSSQLSRPDVEATYRDTKGNGAIVTDAQVRLADLPLKMSGAVGLAGEQIDSVAFEVLNGESIASVDFLARNWTSAPAGLPEVELGPDQFVAFASRPGPAGSTRWRAAGHLRAVRSASYERQGDDNETLDLRADVGDGLRPLRALADLDDRGSAGGRRVTADVNAAPLPRGLHANIDPSRGDQTSKVLYESAQTTEVTADVRVFGGPALGADDCGDIKSTCLSAKLDRLPPTLRVELPGDGGTDFSVSHDRAQTPPDVRATLDRTNQNAADRTYAEVGLLRVPPRVRGRLDASPRGVLRAAEFHACDFDFAADACRDQQRALGRVSFAVRDTPGRAGLPARPATVPSFVAVLGADPDAEIGGDERFEAAGRVDEVRNVAFHQRDADDNGEPDGTLGVRIDVGAQNTPFDAVVDTAGFVRDKQQVMLGARKDDVRVHVDALPQRFDACVRSAAESEPADPDDLPADALLAPCDRTDVLGRDQGELDTTPLSVVYRASSGTKVTGSARSAAPDTTDKDAQGKPIQHVSALDATISELPAEVRADVIPPAANRKLEVRYAARDAQGGPAIIDQLDITRLEARRTGSACADPRSNRLATCARATITDIPSDLTLNYDSNASRGDFELLSSEPEDPEDRPSVTAFHIDQVKPGSGARPLVLDGHVLALTPRISGRIQQADLDGKPGLELAELSLDACRDSDGEQRCNGDAPFGHGVEEVRIDAANTLVTEALPDPPPDSASHQVSFVARGNDYHAAGTIPDFRELTYSRLHPESAQVIPSTRVRLGFGDGSAAQTVRAYVDMRDGSSETVADTVLSQAPRAFELCMRPPVAAAVVVPESPVWCEAQEPRRTVAQVHVIDPGEGDARPDIDVKRLLMTTAARTSILHGKVKIDDLGERIDVIGAAEPREDPDQLRSCANGEDDDGDGNADGTDPDCDPRGADVLVEGRNADGELADVAGRITAEMQNFIDRGDEAQIGPRPGAGFPYEPLEEGLKDPADDSDNGPDGARNYVSASLDSDGRFYARASVPQVRRLAIQPGPCYTDDRVRNDYAAGSGPSFSCIRVAAAKHQPVGLAFRKRGEVKNPEAGEELLALEQGQITQMPGGDDGFQATIAAIPAEMDLAPLCPEKQTLVAGEPPTCRPPLLSLLADQGDTQVDTRLVGRVLIGPRNVLSALRDVEPLDEASALLKYEAPPKDYPGNSRGARIKLGSDPEKGTAVRVGVNMTIPRFLDFYPPTVWSCTHTDPGTAGTPEACEAEKVGSDFNRGLESQDIALKIVGDNFERDGAGLDSLGQFAVLHHKFGEGGGQIVLTGMPKPRNNNTDTLPSGAGLRGASHFTPETLHTVNDDSINGANLPGHLDVRLQMRNDYNATEDLVDPKVGFVLSDGDNQQNFTQIDGRVNVPLSLTVRLNKKLQQTRDERKVSGVSLSAFNLPGTNGQKNFAQPSFRVRAELRETFQGLSVQDQITLVAKHLKGFRDAVKESEKFIEAVKALDVVSLIKFDKVLPKNPIPSWVDVKLNADPKASGNTSSDTAARTVDVVGGPFGLVNHVELRGFREVRPFVSGGLPDFGKGPAGSFVPQANLRLTNLDLGVSGELSFLGLAGVQLRLINKLDAILGVAGAGGRVRIGNALTAVGLRNDFEDFARVETDAEATAHLETFITALWGLIEERIDSLSGAISAPIPQGIDFHSCDDFGDFFDPLEDFYTSSDMEDAAISLAFPGEVAGDQIPAAILGVALAVATKVLAPFGCGVHAFLDTDKRLVTDRHPAPSYDVAGHSVPGAPIQSDETRPSLPAVDPPAPDLDVKGPITRCGSLDVGRLRVFGPYGRLKVGAEGTEDDLGQPCEGTLAIDAESVEVFAGGAIDASATRVSTGGPGVGGAGGGGAGHHTFGGKSGTGAQGGRPYAETSKDPNHVGANGPIADFGSRGGQGSAGQGGGGGGTLHIAARENVTVDGSVLARGGDGADGDTEDCGTSGSGGGSGGAILITGLRVRGTGTVDVGGGQGGDGGYGGGGASAGRITIDTIAQGRPQHLERERGLHGASPTCGEAGSLPFSGGEIKGVTRHTAAFVTLHPDTPGPIQASTTVKLNVRAIHDDGGAIKIIVCRRGIAANDPEQLASKRIDPLPPFDPNGMLVGASCVARPFSGPNVGSEYRETFEVTAGEGHHGWYAFVATAWVSGPVGERQCTSPVDVPHCTFQEELPHDSTASLTIDRTPPRIDADPPFQPNGKEGCPFDTRCLREATATFVAPVEDIPAGVATVKCAVDKGPNVVFSNSCGGEGVREVQLGPGDGSRRVQLYREDAVGNNETTEMGHWWVDRRAPRPPKVKVEYLDAEVNGWHRQLPDVTVEAFDPGSSSGFPDKPITFIVDGSPFRCGTGGGGVFPTDVKCTPAQTREPLDQLEGEHELRATAIDVAGNRSSLGEAKLIRVDSKPPKSKLVLEPPTEDGLGGWYRTRPFFAFAVGDPQGSGFDAEVRAPDDEVFDPVTMASSVRFRVDSGRWHTWNPDDDNANRLGDGVHRICFYGVDVAGNPESDVELPGQVDTQPRCRDNIRVDATAPVVAAPIDPATPDGQGGWYLSAPTVTPSASDPVPAPGTEVSGLARTEVSVDGGDWVPATATTVAEGTHTVAARAFDAAGNESEVVEQLARVDRSDPAVRPGAFPPAANDQNWRRRPLVATLAASDGGDGSGILSRSLQVGTAPAQPYVGPVVVGEGVRDVIGRARDIVGRQSAPVTLRSAVDLTAPTGGPVGPAPQPLILSALTGSTTTLRYTAADTATERVRVQVKVYDELGNVVRHLGDDTWQLPGPGSVTWNGRNDSDNGVLPGIYHYRVHVVDQAGNTAISDQSENFLVLLGLLPL